MGMTFTADDFAAGNAGIPVNGVMQTPNVSLQDIATTDNQYYTPNQTGNVLGMDTTNPNVQAPVQVAPKPVLNHAAVANTQKALDELPGILQRALDAEQQKYTNAEGIFNAQQTAEQGRYDKGTETNQLNYDANLMASLRAGAKGLSGLMAILRGTGAEGWANDVVRDTTSSDIRTGLDTRNENQTSLDNGIGSFLTELAGKRRDNKSTLENNQFAHRGANATQLQKLYGDMAGFYSDAEDTGNATNWMNKSGDQSADIARYSTAPVRAFDATPVNVKAAPITAFGGATEQNVGYDGGKNSNNGIFTIGDTRRKLAGVGA